MGYFSRKKQAEKTVNPDSDKHVEGVVRRGLTESDRQAAIGPRST